MEKFKSKRNVRTLLGDKADQVVIAPEISKKDIKEENEETHHVTVGGFSPFTIGHHEVVKSMQKSDGKVHVYTTQSTKRPISAENKVKYIKKAVGKNVSVNSTINPFHALTHLYNSGARGHVVFHGGSDRAEIADRLAQFNGVEGKHGYYKFSSIKFKQTGGERKEGAKGIAGVSGSLARKAKSPEELKKYLPKELHPQAAEIHKQINEDMFYEAVLDIAARRKRAQSMRRRSPRLQQQRMLQLKRFASDLKLKRRAQNVARNMVRARAAGLRGKNYKNLSVSDKIAVDRMIQGKEKVIKAVASRIYQRVRKREMERVSRARSNIKRAPGKKIVFAHTEYEGSMLSEDKFNAIFKKAICVEYNLKDKEFDSLYEKSNSNQISFLEILEQYKAGVEENNSKEITNEQSAFNRVNSFIAFVKEGEKEDDLETGDYKLSKSGKKIRAHKIIFSKKDDYDDAMDDDMDDKREMKEEITESFVMDRSAGIGVTYTAADLGIKAKGGFAYHPSVMEMVQDTEISDRDQELMQKLGFTKDQIDALKRMKQQRAAQWHKIHGD